MSLRKLIIILQLAEVIMAVTNLLAYCSLYMQIFRTSMRIISLFIVILIVNNNNNINNNNKRSNYKYIKRNKAKRLLIMKMKDYRIALILIHHCIAMIVCCCFMP